MENFTAKVPATACSFETIRKSMMIFACTALALFWLPVLSLAQSSTLVNVTDLGFQVQIPNVTLAAGQVVEATVTVGSVQGARGYDLWFELGTDAEIVSSLEPSLNGSWMADATTTLSETPATSSTTTYRYQLQRTSPVSGNGTVLKIRIRAAHNDVQATRLVAKAGGLMQIDNLDLRMASSNSTLSVWPNPLAVSAGNYALQVRDASPIQGAKLMRSDGLVIATFGPTEVMDMQQIPAGTYLLQVTTGAGEVQYRKVLLN